VAVQIDEDIVAVAALPATSRKICQFLRIHAESGYPGWSCLIALPSKHRTLASRHEERPSTAWIDRASAKAAMPPCGRLPQPRRSNSCIPIPGDKCRAPDLRYPTMPKPCRAVGDIGEARGEIPPMAR
jgi:hypothetical protein